MKMTFAELAERCNALPIKEVLERVGCVFSGAGPNLKTISPLRPSGSLGSFNINVPQNLFHDWKLDVAGGPVKFYMELYNISFVDAVKKLAKEYGLGYFSGRPSKDVEKKILTIQTVKHTLNIDLIDTVYRIFLDMLTLTEEDKALLKVRGFSDEEIEQYGFKTFPRRLVGLRNDLEAKVKEAVGTADALFDVPGFFKKEGEPFSFGYQSGIIIPCRNYEGKILGLQIRKRDPKADSKYVWFSSSYCLKEDADNNYLRDGLSPGSPIGYEPGVFKQNKKIFITEGFFKAVSIRKQYGMSAITIQGVTNWKPIMQTINGLKSKFPKFEGVIIAYDSDMCYNFNVLTQAAKLGQELMNNGINVEYALWDYTEETKGIDDLIAIYGDIKPYLRMKTFETFSEGVKALSTIVDARSADEAVREAFIKYVFNN
jgi:hypothetical protein